MTSRRPRSKQTSRADRHLRVVETPDDDEALGVQPPRFIPLTEEREIQAVAALTVLFRDALAARRINNDAARKQQSRRRAA